ncbi:Flp family type IVb pilin [Thermaurantiacus sp.]
MRATLNDLIRDRSGATAIEYGLIAAFVALAIVATLPAIRNNLGLVFNKVNTELSKGAKGK